LTWLPNMATTAEDEQAVAAAGGERELTVALKIDGAQGEILSLIVPTVPGQRNEGRLNPGVVCRLPTIEQDSSVSIPAPTSYAEKPGPPGLIGEGLDTA